MALPIIDKSTLTPRIAIHKFCLMCVESVYDVKDCKGDTSIDGCCPLFEHRTGHQPKQRQERTPIKAIRAKCLSCVMTAHEVHTCVSEDTCPLWQYRLGRNPARAGISGEVTEERLANLKKARQSRFESNKSVAE